MDGAGEVPIREEIWFDHAHVQPAPGGSFARREHKSCCDQKEKSKATCIKKDLGADVVKYFPNLHLQAAAARSITLDSEISLELARILSRREGI